MVLTIETGREGLIVEAKIEQRPKFELVMRFGAISRLIIVLFGRCLYLRPIREQIKIVSPMQNPVVANFEDAHDR